MPVSIPVVSTSDTFEEWRVKTNEIAQNIATVEATSAGVGLLIDLLTENKANAVSAINEVLEIAQINTISIGDKTTLLTTTKNSLVSALNEFIETVGDLETLNTTEKTSVVSSINELSSSIEDLVNNAITEINENIGTLGNLDTSTTVSLVDAINEVFTSLGDLDDLDTSASTSIVAAVNELANAVKVHLTTNVTFYVRTDGDDSNYGWTDDQYGAFKTIQKAVDYISTQINSFQSQIVIQVGAGTYTGVNFPQPAEGSKPIIIRGDTTVPGNVIISTTNDDCFACENPSKWKIEGFKLTTTTSGNGIKVRQGGVVEFESIEFGSIANNQIDVETGGVVEATGNYSISGSGQVHWNINNGGILKVSGKTVTITNTPTFSSGFLVGKNLSCIDATGNTFTASVTGVRYNLSLNSSCFVNGESVTYIPGSSAGVTSTGGQYA